MLDASGTSRMDYEEVLRTIGHYIDENNLKEICIIELKEGLLVRGLQFRPTTGALQMMSESVLFTNEDIEKLIEDAYQRRAEEQAKLQAQAQAQQSQEKRGFFGR